MKIKFLKIQILENSIQIGYSQKPVLRQENIGVSFTHIYSMQNYSQYRYYTKYILYYVQREQKLLTSGVVDSAYWGGDLSGCLE